MQNATVYTNLQKETTFGDIIQTNIWICFFVRIDSNSKIGYSLYHIEYIKFILEINYSKFWNYKKFHSWWHSSLHSENYFSSF